MNNLQKIVDAYTKMDQRRRNEAVARMARIADAHPMVAAALPRKGSLSLVVDNSLRVGAPGVPSGVHDFRLIIGVGGVVQS